MHQHLVTVVFAFGLCEIAEHGFRAARGQIGYVFGVDNKVLKVEFLQTCVPEIIDDFCLGSETMFARRRHERIALFAANIGMKAGQDILFFDQPVKLAAGNRTVIVQQAGAVNLFFREVAVIDTGDDVSLLAEELNGAWFPEAWVERADADVPTQVLAAAFRWARPAEGSVLREIVPLASGDYAVLALSGVEPGSVDAIPREERNAQNAQLAEQASLAELSAYAREVRDDATVRIPDIVLNPIY